MTPCHSDSGSLLSQLLLSVQLSPSVALYSATSAARSIAIPGSIVAVAVSVGVEMAVALGVPVAVALDESN